MIIFHERFYFKEEYIPRLAHAVKFVRQEEFSESYFDYPDYWLTTHDRWLSKRGNSFLVMARKNLDTVTFPEYERLVDREKIFSHLRLTPQSTDFGKNVAKHGLKVFAEFGTIRRIYRYRGIVLKVDRTDFEYSLLSISAEIPNRKKIPVIEKDIQHFLKGLDFELRFAHSRVMEYVRLHNRIHYRMLMKMGVAEERYLELV